MYFECRDENISLFMFQKGHDDRCMCVLLAHFWEKNVLGLNCMNVGRELMTMGKCRSQGQTGWEPLFY